MLARTPELSALQNRVEELEEENLQLWEKLAPTRNFPAEWRLCESERRILSAFMTRTDGYLTYDSILSLAIKFRDRRGTHYVGTVIFKLRRKLEFLNIEIFCNRGYGYHITRASRDLISKALAAREIVEAVKHQFAA